MKTADFIASILSHVKRTLANVDREPKIKKKCNLNGKPYWQAHDPNTNQSYTFTSEQDVRVWIEEHYRYFN